MTKVLVTRRIPESGLGLLRRNLGPDNIVVAPQDEAVSHRELMVRIRDFDALLPMAADIIDDELMEVGERLRIIANYGVGYDNVDVAAATRHRILVTNTPDVLTETVADMTWGLLIGAARRLFEAERYVRGGEWNGWSPTQFLGMDVHGSVLGVYGMGRVGHAVARRARAFEMQVIYCDPIVNVDDCELTRVEKARLLRDSDFISIHCPLTVDTRRSFGMAEFKAMKRTACLVNTSRGPVVDEKALAKALKDGEIFAAGLDVYDEEPKIRSELLGCPNAIVIPHLGSATEATREKMAELAARNILAFTHGEAPPNCVNPEVSLELMDS